MKHYVLIAALALVMLAGGVLSVRHWDSYKKGKVASEASAVSQAKKAQFDADQQVFQVLVERYNAQTVQCQNGVAAYVLLTPAEKAKLPAPTCSVELVR